MLFLITRISPDDWSILTSRRGSSYGFNSTCGYSVCMPLAQAASAAGASGGDVDRDRDFVHFVESGKSEDRIALFRALFSYRESGSSSYNVPTGIEFSGESIARTEGE